MRKSKTGQEIEDDIYRLVKEGDLPSLVSGSLYRYDMRPRDSQKEDIIVKFVTGYDSDIQSGTVVVNIYIPDIDPYDNGVFVRDIARCKELEIAANEWAQSLTAAKSNYRFWLAQTIYTEEETELKQHFVTIRLRFRLPTF